ncbi:NhaA family Na+:H+ antiporter [Lacibacter cauensis]|uniref:Na(+)/H(+) antiporter NhaA n=1 Tax=Lacibacter cauensis TaxID=510947 RepID=A0A562SUR1_9BACT|nr:Na+/H+ antiporter NhaA [Lacibacter cauensis]TWI85057.1 NhaA family Na+:H+ antiporter [Lacibacter cauensis]
MPFSFLKKVFISPLLEFIHDSRAVGIMLLICTVVSLVISNTFIGEYYLNFWNAEVHLGAYMPHTVLHWINDGLMAIFFFQVGMEIKREMVTGELASIKQSILPVAGAVGGMLVPALIFTIFNSGTEFANGWGVPMATDIAFSLGIASLLSGRVPLALKIFLTALAIIDDLGAIVAIAIFYTSTIKFVYLFGGLGIFALLLVLTRLKVKFGFWNFLLGAALWFCFFNSGVHATIAGVLFAFTIPIKKLDGIEHALHNYVNFLIIPIFALANTAIVIPLGFTEHMTNSLSIGIIAGLLLGKPLGIVLFCWLLVKLKIGQLAEGINWKHMIGLGLLAGIGFTMSIFISMLAFKDSFTQDISKMAVMVASVLAIICGYAWFKFFIKEKQ